MSSKINAKFWAAIEAGDVTQVRKCFNLHRGYLTKINSPLKLVNALMGLQQYPLALSFYKRPEVFKKKVEAKDYLLFRCTESSYYLSQDCYMRAHAILEDIWLNAQDNERRLISVYKGDAFLMEGKYCEAVKCYQYYLDDNWDRVRSFSLIHNYTLALLYTKQFECARESMERLPLLVNDPLKEVSLQLIKALFEFYADSEHLSVVENKLENLLANCPDQTLKCKMSHLLAMIAEKRGDNQLAISYYLKSCDFEGVPPQTALFDNYRPLHALGYPLSAFEKVALFCYPTTNENKGGLVYQLRDQHFEPCHYCPNDEKDDYIDLVSGRYCLNGKTQWLTKLQARFLLALVSSGNVGQHICNLESLIFESDDQNKGNGIKRVEVMLVYIKRLGFQFKRKDNVIFFIYQPSIKYIIPTRMNYQGPMAILQFYKSFGRADLENILFIKKSVAADIIKKWIHEERVFKRPDLGANLYSVTPHCLSDDN